MLRHNVLDALDELARIPVDPTTMSLFLASQREEANIEVTKQLERVVQPWVATLSMLVQLADVYTLDEFRLIADHCADNYRVVTELSASVVLTTMMTYANIYASTQPFDDNWRYLAQAIEAKIGTDPYHFGDFVL